MRKSWAGMAFGVLSWTMAACGGPGDQLTNHSGLDALALIQSAIRQAGSFHFVDTSHQGSTTTELTGDIGPNAAQETFTTPNSVLQVRFVNNVLYVQGDAGVLQNILGLSAAVAAANAHHWVSLISSDAPYQQVVGTLSIDSEVSAYLASPHPGVSTTTLHGTTVAKLTGGLPASAVHSTGTITVDASLSTPFLPDQATIAATTLASTGKQSSTDTVVFGNWGERVTPSVPAGVVTFASIRG